MKKINYNKIAGFIVSCCFTFLLPIFVIHALPGPGCDGVSIKNPLGCNNTEVEDLLLKIMNIVAMLGGLVVVFMIIYSGFKMVMAQGKPADLEKAKDMLLATVVGGAILLGADIIANVVVNTVKDTVGVVK